MVVSNRNLLFQGLYSEGRLLLVSGRLCFFFLRSMADVDAENPWRLGCWKTMGFGGVARKTPGCTVTSLGGVGGVKKHGNFQ